jgi:hypothetical protein
MKKTAEDTMDKRIEKLLIKLKDRNMAGYFLSNHIELNGLLQSLITAGTTVGCGDSVTLEQTGVFDFLRKGPYHFLDKFDPALNAHNKREIYIKNFSADTFITGTNAITLNGEIFNIDGNGSRVAPMLYGPAQVIIVVGMNKVTDDIESAIQRTRQIAAPLDAKRLNKTTPCVSLDRCIDCKHSQRICNDFVLITGQFIKDRIKVIIIDQNLGY